MECAPLSSKSQPLIAKRVPHDKDNSFSVREVPRDSSPSSQTDASNTLNHSVVGTRMNNAGLPSRRCTRSALPHSLASPSLTISSHREKKNTSITINDFY